MSANVDVREALAAWCNEKNIGRDEWLRRTSVESAVAELVEENKRLQVKANLWDDLMAARTQTQAEPDSVEWKRLARQGNAISAIKACRSIHGYSLREAKDCVEAYMGRASGAAP